MANTYIFFNFHTNFSFMKTKKRKNKILFQNKHPQLINKKQRYNIFHILGIVLKTLL